MTSPDATSRREKTYSSTQAYPRRHIPTWATKKAIGKERGTKTIGTTQPNRRWPPLTFWWLLVLVFRRGPGIIVCLEMDRHLASPLSFCHCLILVSLLLEIIVPTYSFEPSLVRSVSTKRSRLSTERPAVDLIKIQNQRPFSRAEFNNFRVARLAGSLEMVSWFKRPWLSLPRPIVRRQSRRCATVIASRTSSIGAICTNWCSNLQLQGERAKRASHRCNRRASKASEP